MRPRSKRLGHITGKSFDDDGEIKKLQKIDEQGDVVAEVKKSKIFWLLPKLSLHHRVRVTRPKGISTATWYTFSKKLMSFIGIKKVPAKIPGLLKN